MNVFTALKGSQFYFYTTADLQLFIIIKHYIYATKRLNQPLSLIALLRKIKYLHSLEQHTATVKLSINLTKIGLNTEIFYCHYIECSQNVPDNINVIPLRYEPPRGKTNNLHRRKQRRRSASR